MSVALSFDPKKSLNHFFIKELSNDETCKAYLAKIKFQDGFKCIKCGHTRYEKSGYDYHYYTCHHVESATADTLFHKVSLAYKKPFVSLSK